MHYGTHMFPTGVIPAKQIQFIHTGKTAFRPLLLQSTDRIPALRDRALECPWDLGA
jgi:hypothetical protein